MKSIATILTVLLFLLSCVNRDVPRAVDCSATDLALLASTATAPTGCSSSDGLIIVTATGGRQPYTYSLNGAAFQTANNFNGLGSSDYTIAVRDANLCERTLSVKLPTFNNTLDLSIIATPNTSCEVPNGIIDVTGKSGFPPYQYQLNDKGYGSSSSFSGLNAGTYSIFIRDSKGCIKEQKGLNVQSLASTLDGSATATDNTSCESPNGKIEVTGKNGFPPYQYQLNDRGYGSANFFSGLNSGNYSIFIKDSKGCVNEIKGVTVSSLASTLDGIADPTENSNCATPNGAIKVTATGGLAPYQYQLNANGYGASSDFLGLREGSYNISIKDSQQCVKVLVVNVSKAASTLDGSTELTPNSGCPTPDGAIKVTATGGLAPYQYQLNAGAFGTSSTFSALSEGAYTITIKDSKGCEKVLAATVSKTSALDGSSTITADTGCGTSNGNISVTASGGQPPYQYQLNGNAFGSTSVFSNLIPASYSITIKDSKGCTKALTAAVTKSTTNSVVSYANDIVPLMTAKCNFAGCHTSGTRDFTTYDKVKAKAASIKSRTGDRSMPKSGSLTQAQIDLIACWVDGGAPNN